MNGNPKMWNISKTADRRAKPSKIWDSVQYTVHICKVILVPDSLSLVWGHLVHFAKFQIPWFSKHYSFSSFHHILTKLHTKYHNLGLIQTITFFGNLPKIKNSMPLWWFFFSTQDHMGPDIFKTLLLLQFSSDASQTLWEHYLPWWNTGYHFSWQLAKFFQKKIWHFEILTWESIGKPKMWNISKTSDRRAKRTKIWDSVY